MPEYRIIRAISISYIFVYPLKINISKKMSLPPMIQTSRAFISRYGVNIDKETKIVELYEIRQVFHEPSVYRCLSRANRRNKRRDNYETA